MQDSKGGRQKQQESPRILTSSLLKLKALNMGRKEPAYFELPTNVIVMGSVKVRGRVGTRWMSRWHRRVPVDG